MRNNIFIKGARQHNLKNIDVEIPRDKFVVITGVSGSGKSSLAFNTIYAEGQRRYVESLSAYARQFLGQMDKPDVDYIEGLSPAISIEQRGISKNPRSTVGTVTEIYDYMRLLFARIGIPHCPSCGREIRSQSAQQIVDHVLAMPKNMKIIILAPIVRGRKGEYRKELEELKKDGFVRVRIDGEIHELSEDVRLDKNKKHNIDAVVDRLRVGEDAKRLNDSVEIALKRGEGLVIISSDKDYLYSEQLSCPDCGVSFEEFAPRMFSFNSPFGACPECHGLGTKMEIDPDLILPDKNLSLMQGAILGRSLRPGSWSYTVYKAYAEHYGFSLNSPIKYLDKKAIDALLYGTGGEKIRLKYVSEDGSSQWESERAREGVIANVDRLYKQTESEGMKRYYQSFMSTRKCTVCRGKRLRPESLAVTIADKNIIATSEMSVKEAANFFSTLSLSEREELIARQILKEIRERLGFLVSVGLDYLTIDRKAGSLSGGEAQRIRLATQVGSSLMGVLYILDEPSIGLHQRDNMRLINTLHKLRDLGNTVIVIEHDAATILAADYVIDMGPGAGLHGGYIVASGTPHQIMSHKTSLTGRYLSGTLEIETPKERMKPNGNYLTIYGARHNNLKTIDVTIPLGVFTCVTGVSGSGKSSLINDTLRRALNSELYGVRRRGGKYTRMEGVEHIDKVITIDQSPIGRTPRSNPATYTGLFTHIRDVFATLPEARMRGYKMGRFSFNVKGGRCESCQGDGIIKIEMHFLPDVYVPCEVCKGHRFNRETLEVRYKEKNIADVLDMTVEEALSFFENIPAIKSKLETLSDVGLGYIKLGQPATTLSGGEAQRVKLSKELSKRGTGRTLYILDEPTTGLHFDDIRKLLEVLKRLVSKGNSVVVIEHNMDVIKSADFIIDLGPEGGDEGGYLVAKGTPEEIAHTETHTGKFLKKALKRNNNGKRNSK
jgi:excinuclease ABC subunit A